MSTYLKPEKSRRLKQNNREKIPSLRAPGTKGGFNMERKEELKQKEVKILKCVKCGKGYVFDVLSQKCPECGETLKKETILR
jgi:rubrerythrin